MNKAFLFVFLQKCIQSLVGFISILIIAKYMNPDIQGIYFAFASILSSYTIIDLGLSGLLVQLSSKYYFLKNKSQFFNLFKLSINWFFCIAILALLLIPFGNFYFKDTLHYETDFISLPWSVNVILLSLSIIVLPLISIIEGMNKIISIYKLKIIYYTLGAFLSWLFIIYDKPLYAPGAVYFMTFVIVIFYFIYKRETFELTQSNFKKNINNIKFNWWKEIFPLQKKIAYSCIAKYLFIFSPTLFVYKIFSPEIAGQAGMTSIVLNMIASIAFSSMTSKTPLITKLYSEKKISSSNSLFIKELFKTILFTFALFFIFITGLYILNDFYLFNRMLNIVPSIFLCFCFIIIQITSAANVYYRIRGIEALSKTLLIIMIFIYLTFLMLTLFCDCLITIDLFYFYMFTCLFVMFIYKLQNIIRHKLY